MPENVDEADGVSFGDAVDDGVDVEADVELDDGVSFGVPLGSLLEDDEDVLPEVGATGAITGPPERVGVPLEVGVPVELGVPDDVGEPDEVELPEDVVGLVGAGLREPVDDGLGATTGAPGR